MKTEKTPEAATEGAPYGQQRQKVEDATYEPPILAQVPDHQPCCHPAGISFHQLRLNYTAEAALTKQVAWLAWSERKTLENSAILEVRRIKQYPVQQAVCPAGEQMAKFRPKCMGFHKDIGVEDGSVIRIRKLTGIPQS